MHTDTTPAPASGSAVTPAPETVIDTAAWKAAAAELAAAVEERMGAHLARRARGEKHPVEDFLFTYYPFAPAQVARYQPGAGIGLAVPEAADREQFARRWWAVTGDIAFVDVTAWRADRGEGAQFIANLLAATLDREAQLGCFGLHEWAMVYRQSADEHRHRQVPLRLSQAETDRVVESHRIQCSHFDAFRFFTPAARPLNTLTPKRKTMVSMEQPGCLHAGMDLYKWAMKLVPIVPSQVIVAAFDLARDIRTLDMEASPYDVRAWGCGVVAIETAAGKAEYMRRQQAFSQRAQQLRRELLDALAVAGIEPRS
ncbi:3-methyladenine DNA glycosylase [Brevibacterium luteolum]|uniref:3-methyladenine DNA glycosylase n=1 Tax=Brevibacterium luteolum TaxID=199591 RepID=UPI00223B14AE|nr:3-methyladenine DNA glycosylase [Brevibacterium luteolum]MCT1921712.1 3-methyladenine DNA glycosylase [Brevibacterium luteolum]